MSTYGTPIATSQNLGREDLHKRKPEEQRDTKFLPPAHLHAEQMGEGKHDHEDVFGNSKGTGHISDSLDVNAYTLGPEGWDPVGLDWKTLQHDDGGKGDTRAEIEDEPTLDDAMDPRDLGEDLPDEAQNGHLGQRLDQAVHDLPCEDELPKHGRVGRVHVPEV